MRMSVPPSATPIVAQLAGVELVGRDGAWATFEIPDDQVAAARALGAEGAKTAGVIDISLRILVSDAAALIAAGRRSIARDNYPWEPGQPLPPAEDPHEVIDSPAQAMVDLLMEGLARCFRPMVTAPALLRGRRVGQRLLLHWPPHRRVGRRQRGDLRGRGARHLAGRRPHRRPDQRLRPGW